jgi:hypothetical protein
MKKIGKKNNDGSVLNVEQGVEPLLRLDRNRKDHARAFATAPVPGCDFGIGQLEGFASGMRDTVSLQHWIRLLAGRVELVVPATGVGLRDP